MSIAYLSRGWAWRCFILEAVCTGSHSQSFFFDGTEAVVEGTGSTVLIIFGNLCSIVRSLRDCGCVHISWRMKYLNDMKSRLRLQPTLSTANLAVQAICWNGKRINSCCKGIVEGFGIAFNTTKTILQCGHCAIPTVPLRNLWMGMSE